MEQLAKSVREVIVATDGYRRAIAAAGAISTTECAALGELLHLGDCTPTHLAQQLGMTTSSATALLDRLESANLVVRKRHPRDRRRSLITLTEHGAELIESMFALFARDIAAVMAEAAPVDVRLFEEFLQRIAASLRSRAADPVAVAAALPHRTR